MTGQVPSNDGRVLPRWGPSPCAARGLAAHSDPTHPVTRPVQEADRTWPKLARREFQPDLEQRWRRLIHSVKNDNCWRQQSHESERVGRFPRSHLLSGEAMRCDGPAATLYDPLQTIFDAYIRASSSSNSKPDFGLIANPLLQRKSAQSVRKSRGRCSLSRYQCGPPEVCGGCRSPYPASAHIEDVPRSVFRRCGSSRACRCRRSCCGIDLPRWLHRSYRRLLPGRRGNRASKLIWPQASAAVGSKRTLRRVGCLDASVLFAVEGPS